MLLLVHVSIIVNNNSEHLMVHQQSLMSSRWTAKRKRPFLCRGSKGKLDRHKLLQLGSFPVCLVDAFHSRSVMCLS
jgi:hypothetical protein